MELGTPNSKREWWYLIAIIMLCELIFLHLVYTKGYDQDAQRAWEFGHVLIAIVLAVIAMVYTLYQGITQQSTAQNLTANVESLNNVVRTVSTSTDRLSGGMADFQKLAGQLETLGTGVLDQGRHLAAISSKIDKMAADQEPKATPPVQGQQGQVALDKETIKAWLRALPIFSTDAAYLFWRFAGKKYEFTKLAHLFYTSLTDGSTDKWTGDPGYYAGILSGTRGIFSSMGQITLRNDGMLIVKEPLKSAMDEYFKDPNPEELGFPQKHHELFNKLVAAVDKYLAAR